MIKVNTDPRCPGADKRYGESLTNWDIVHKDKGKYGYTKRYAEAWTRIFGKREEQNGR